MGGAGSIVLHHEAPPVRDRIVVGVGLVVFYPVLDLVCRVELEEAGGIVVVIEKFIGHFQETGDTHHIGLCRGDFQTELTGVSEAEVGFVAALGGDEDNACCSLGSIDGGSRSILQHGDTLHVGGVHIVHAAHLHSVHYIKRIGGADGGDTSHADGTCRSARSRVVAGDHNSGKGALEGGGKGGGLLGLDVFPAHGCHGTGEVFALDSAVTDDDNLVEKLGVRLQGHFDVGPRSGDHILVEVADERHGQGRALRDFQGEVSLEPRGRSCRGALDKDGCAHECLAVLVGHYAGNLRILGKCRHRDEHHAQGCEDLH